MDKKEAGSPAKRGRPLKKPDPNEDPKKRANREAQNRYKQRVGSQIGNVVNDLDECDEERAALKEKVSKLTKLLADCEKQVSGIMDSVRNAPSAGAKKEQKTRQNKASTVIGSAIRQNLARKKMKEVEKEETYKILIR
jgi:hypothetical protein